MNSNFNNNNADCIHMGCVNKFKSEHFIRLKEVEQETAVDTQNKNTE